MHKFWHLSYKLLFCEYHFPLTYSIFQPCQLNGRDLKPITICLLNLHFRAWFHTKMNNQYTYTCTVWHPDIFDDFGRSNQDHAICMRTCLLNTMNCVKFYARFIYIYMTSYMTFQLAHVIIQVVISYKLKCI